MSVQAQKGNKILRISEDAVERYFNMGYSILSDGGTVVKKAVPTDNNQLKLEYAQNANEIITLKAEVASLKEQIVALTEENKRLATELEEAKAVPEKPTRRRRQSVEKVVEEKAEEPIEQLEEQVTETEEETE